MPYYNRDPKGDHTFDNHPYLEALSTLEALMQEEEEAYDYTCFKGHPDQDRMVKSELLQEGLSRG